MFTGRHCSFQSGSRICQGFPLHLVYSQRGNATPDVSLDNIAHTITTPQLLQSWTSRHNGVKWDDSSTRILFYFFFQTTGFIIWYIWFLIDLNVPFHSTPYRKLCPVWLTSVLLLLMTAWAPAVPLEQSWMQRCCENSRQRQRGKAKREDDCFSKRWIYQHVRTALYISILWSLFYPIIFERHFAK